MKQIEDLPFLVVEKHQKYVGSMFAYIRRTCQLSWMFTLSKTQMGLKPLSLAVRPRDVGQAATSAIQETQQSIGGDEADLKAKLRGFSMAT